MYYFASDVHLGGGTPLEASQVEERFVKWLDYISGDALEIFLLGDIFDFWFEYRLVVPKGCVRTLAKLSELTARGIKVHFFPGNHDMWVRDYFHTECGVQIHTNLEVLELAQRRVLLAHGDNLNIGSNLTLRLMNATFRSRTAKALFSWLVHPDIALWFGRWWSNHSRHAHDGKPPKVNVDYTNILDDFARSYLASDPNVNLFFFGHMHSAGVTKEQGYEVVHLGEWSKTPQYAKMDDKGCVELLKFGE